MDKTDIGRRAVIIITSSDTTKGVITDVLSELMFEITDDYGNASVWNINLIMGLKWKGDAQ